MTTRLANCPTCGTPVHQTHRCKGAPPREAPTPPPPELRQWIAEARARALAGDEPALVEQLELLP